MTPQEIAVLHSRLQEINKLDEMLSRLSRNPEDKLEELGEKVISVLGSRVITKSKDWTGEVVFVAIFNALREQRERMRDEIKDRVDVPECGHKVQQIQEQDT